VSFELQDWAIDLEIPCGRSSPFTSNDKVLLIYMCRLENEDGYSWPSQNYLARKTGMARRTINKRLLKWEELGLISSDEGWVGSSGYIGKQYIIKKQAWLTIIRKLNKSVTSSHISVTASHSTDNERVVTSDHSGVLPEITPPCDEGLHNNLDNNLIHNPNIITDAKKIDGNISASKRERNLTKEEKIFVSRLTNAYFDYFNQQESAIRNQLPSYTKLEEILTSFTAGNDRSEAAWRKLDLGLPTPQTVMTKPNKHEKKRI
jgi:hypothetical protein